MAIYSFHMGNISRGKGQSSVKNAASICGIKLLDERTGLKVGSANKKVSVILYNTLFPACSKYRSIDVWNAVEKFEDNYADEYYKREETIHRYKSICRTAFTIFVALPNELSVQKNKDLIETFVKNRFISRNLIATYAIRMSKNNLHSYIQITYRPVGEDGEFLKTKDRFITSPRELFETRRLWAEAENTFLAESGSEARVTEKSYKALGINLQGSKHRGNFSEKTEVGRRIAAENKKILEDNKKIKKEVKKITPF